MIHIVMRGGRDVSLINEKEIDTHDFSCVLNFSSNKKFSYYKTDKSDKEIVQYAVKTAKDGVSHILFISSGVVLNDFSYPFEKEMKPGMYTDGDSWETRKIALIKVTKESRMDISTIKDVEVGHFENSVFEYNPEIGDMSNRLLRSGCDFNKSVAQIRALHTLVPHVPKPRIFIGTPCFNASISCNYTTSLIRTIDLLKSKGIDTEIHFLPNQIVTRARNILAHRFMQGSCSHLFFIDADIQWNPEDVLRLLNHKKEICIGLYANKTYLDNVKSDNRFKKIQYSSRFFTENNTMNNDKLMEIKYGATGFMMIERRVFEDTIDLAPEYKYNNDTLNDYFPCKVVDGDYLTEDYAFCEMWRKKGGKVWADLSICLNHEGWHSFHGNPLQTFSVEGQ